MTAIKVNQGNSYKIGLDEIEGLKDAMAEVLKPLVDHLKDKIYWNDLELQSSEYKSRDGFSPYSHNCGGLDLTVVIPKCEEYDFSYLGFGECDECTAETQCGYNGQECGADGEGHLDAKLRVWLKFEGLETDANGENGVMSFYLVLSGGNEDAPYFREKYSSTYFESDFQAASISSFKKKAAKHIAKLIKLMK
jgi:hypothetical protein